MRGYEGPRTRINFCVLRDVYNVAKEIKITLEEIKGALRSCWDPCALPVWYQQSCSETVLGFTSELLKRYRQIGKNTKNVPGVRTPAMLDLFWAADNKEVI